MIEFKIFLEDDFHNKLKFADFFYDYSHISFSEFFCHSGGLEIKINGKIEYQSVNLNDHFDAVYYLLQIWQYCKSDYRLNLTSENRLDLDGGICQLIELDGTYLSLHDLDQKNCLIRNMDLVLFTGSKDKIGEATEHAINHYFELVKKMFGEKLEDSFLNNVIKVW